MLQVLVLWHWRPQRQLLGCNSSQKSSISSTNNPNHTAPLNGVFSNQQILHSMPLKVWCFNGILVGPGEVRVSPEWAAFIHKCLSSLIRIVLFIIKWYFLFWPAPLTFSSARLYSLSAPHLLNSSSVSIRAESSIDDRLVNFSCCRLFFF